MENNKRRTGRTTRMLEAAIACAAEGNAVVVMCANERDRRNFMDFIKKATDPRFIINWSRYRVHVPEWKGGEICFCIADGLSWDWKRKRMAGRGDNTKYFIDHYAVEGYIQPLVKLMNKWDLKNGDSMFITYQAVGPRATNPEKEE